MEVGKYLIDVPMEIKFPGVKKVGKTYMMRCPFHDDNTPSMLVTPEGRYYCFGCNERGGYISYLIKLYGLSFPEAVKKIEEITGVSLSGYYSPEYQRIIEINSEAASFYRASITYETRAYLHGRGISDESIERFALGYAHGGNRLLTHLLKKGYRKEEIRKAGLLKSIEDSDFFNKRLVIPIKNCAGIAGFSSRAINDTGTGPKYLNSPETKVFKKSRLLYGLDSKGIKKHGSAIIVEGYFDVIAMHQSGYDNTVAVMSTGVSDDHVEILKKYTDRVILAMDGDAAGRKATVKSSEKLVLSGFDTAVAIFGDMDPDEFIRNGGDVRKVLESSQEGGNYLCIAMDDRARKRFLYNVGINQLAPSVISSLEEKERIYFQEISSKAILESLRERFNLIVRVKQLQIEVRRAGDILIAFTDGKLVCSKKIRYERFLKEGAKNLARIVAKSKNESE
ncbi:MAG: DNA primase [Nitrospirae bacterium]|nr:DNA primase [Nitrospirota bacterium]